MKYIKLVLAGILVAITSFQFFTYGFLDNRMIYLLLYCLFYLAMSLYQKFHKSSIFSQIFTLIYTVIPLVILIPYGVREGFSHLTQTFYIVFMAALCLALLWEIISLFLVIKEKSDE